MISAALGRLRDVRYNGPVTGSRFGGDRSEARRLAVGAEADIVQAVQQACARRGRVRAVGARGSKNGSHQTPGASLHLDRYNSLLSVSDRLVTIQAGMTCGDLNGVLERHGLALPTMGEWKHATLAGAVLTGTHGASCRHGILSTSVRAVRIVTGDGRVIQVERGDRWFPHVGVSLGLLGIVSTITFECVELFGLALEARVVPADRYLAEYRQQNQDNEFYSAVWIPAADAVITYAANRTAAPARPVRRPQRTNFSTLLLTALGRHWNTKPLVTDRCFRRRVVGTGGDILTPIALSPRLARAVRQLAKGVHEVEFAVPAHRATATVTALDALLRRHPGSLANAVGLRESAGDSFSLSPCFQRGCFWVSLFFRQGDEFVADLRELFQRLEARCHWGKHVMLPADHLRGQYPNWNAFIEARTELDPMGVFANDFAHEYGLA